MFDNYIGHSPCGSVDWNDNHYEGDEAIYVTPLVGVWIEITSLPLAFITFVWHSPCGSVDWNRAIENLAFDQTCHSPCGSVDWNKRRTSQIERTCVTPLVGVWIEILKYVRTSIQSLRHSPCGCVDWNLDIIRDGWRVSRHSPCGSVDWNFDHSF